MTIEIITLTDDFTLNTFFSIFFYLTVAFVPFFAVLGFFKQ